jgi:integrase
MTEATARAKLRKLIRETEEANAVRQDKITPGLASLLQQVVEHYQRHARKSTEHVERHCRVLAEFFKGLRADEITRPRLLSYVDERRKIGYSNGTINRELAALRLAYSLGKKNGLKPEFAPPIDASVMQPEARPRQGFFESEDYQALLGHLPKHLRGPLVLAYFSGARKEEILSLQWSQVDLVNRLVHYEKTKNGLDRTLAMNDELFDVFREAWAGRWDDPEECPYVFHLGPSRIGDFRKSWHTACVAAGLGKWVQLENGKRAYEGRIFHDLRRSGVRNLRRAGIAESVAMRISGHLDARIFRRYDICDLDDVRVAMQKVSELERRMREEREERLRALETSHTLPEGQNGGKFSSSNNTEKVTIN